MMCAALIAIPIAVRFSADFSNGQRAVSDAVFVFDMKIARIREADNNHQYGRA